MSMLYCPHCGGELLAYDNAKGGRCPACRLVVGVGRARETSLDDVRTGGFMANAARREDAKPVPAEEAFLALGAVAASIGCGVERLRMTDYDKAAREGRVGPSVAQVLATFDTWKAARMAAGARHMCPPPTPSASAAEHDAVAAHEAGAA